MSAIKGDFLGFTFDGVHSSELGVFRISDGSRYTENLLPTMQDKTVQVPGADGTYYFNSYYTQKQINFPIAFDSLTEEGLRRLKQLFSDKKVHSLIFDEHPYKIYKVKATGTPSLKYVCFDKPERDEDEGTYDPYIETKEELYGVKGTKKSKSRVYKGEGQLSFTCYNPFARSRFKYLDEYVTKNIPEWGPMGDNMDVEIYENYSEWARASRMIRSNSTLKRDHRTSNSDGDYSGTIDYYVVDKPVLTKGEGGNAPSIPGVAFYNAGDLPTHFRMDFVEGEEKGVYSFSLYLDGQEAFKVENLELGDGDEGFRINSRLNLIEGIDRDHNSTGRIYNKYITGGDFFKLPVTEELTFLQIVDSTGALGTMTSTIDYDYLYY